MAQYVLFLAVAPLALFGTVLANVLPRLVHSYHRFAWLRIYNYLQLGLLVCNLTEFLTKDPSLKQALASADYLFLGTGAAVWLFFCLEYIGILRQYRLWQALFIVIPALSCAFGLANGRSGLVWRDLQFVDLGWIMAMKSGSYGPAAMATIVQAYTLTLVGAFMLLQHTIPTHKLFRKQTYWMLAGVILPIATNLAFILKLVDGWSKDFSAPMAALGGFCFSIGCLRYRLFSVVPVSRQTLFQHLHLGMLVTDASGSIVDLNAAACRIIGKSEIQLLGSPSEPVLKGIPDRYELTRHPILGPGGQVDTWHIELRTRHSTLEQIALPADEEDVILSLGELRVLEMLACNLSNKEIAQRLGVTVSTVKFHLSNAFQKTGAANRADLLHRTADILNGKSQKGANLAKN